MVSDRPLRVVLVCSGLMFGGGQRVVSDIKQCFGASREVSVDVWLLGRSAKTERMADQMIDGYDGRYNRPQTLWHALRALQGLIRRHKPDVLHSHGWDADLLAWLAAGRRGPRRLMHLHVLGDWLDSRRWRHAARRYVATKMIRSSASTVAVSAAVANRWSDALGLHDRAITVVPNSIDVVQYRPAAESRQPSSSFTLGLVSRLVPGKGVDLALRVLARLRGQFPGLRLAIAGDGALRSELESMAADLQVADAVQWAGHLDDMLPFYQRIDAYIQASFAEGMPLGLMEAMACACPVVASRVGGTAEVVNDGVEGWLVDAGDEPAFCRSIQSLIEEPRRRQRMGTAARARIEKHFSMPVLAKRLMRLYRATNTSNSLAGGVVGA